MRGTTAMLSLSFSVAAATPPHIMLTVMDDLGWADLGFRGSEIKTPHIDKLASEGVVLENYYVMPSCAPTRSTMMTGRFVTRTGIYTPFAGCAPEGVPLHEKFLPQVLKDAGYATHMVGKWHLGFFKEEYTPTFRGFDTYYGFYGWGEDYTLHTTSYPLANGSNTAKGYDFRWEKQPNCGKGCSVIERAASGTYSTNLFAKRAVDIISAHDPSTPLFLYLPWQAVHAPRQVPKTWAAPYQGGHRVPDFAGMAAAADVGIENVTSALDARGMLKNTVIVFSTDNGGPIEDPGMNEGDAIGASNWPLRGGKHTLWEGGTRGTAFVWATDLTAGQYHGLAHSVDWLPTFAKLAGASTNGTLPLDGRDQWSALQGGESPHPFLFTATNSKGGFAIRKGDWKMIAGGAGPGHINGWSSKDECSPEDAKNTGCTGQPSITGSPRWAGVPMLFNVTADPGEHIDLAATYTDVVAELLSDLAPYNASKVPYHYALAPGVPDGEPMDGVWGPWA